MATYSHEFSNFPEQLITKHNFVDVDDKTADLYNQINSLRANKKCNDAARLIRENSDKLENRTADSVTFRTIFEEIWNTQVYAKQKQQVVFTQIDEPECETGDIWIGV